MRIEKVYIVEGETVERLNGSAKVKSKIDYNLGFLGKVQH